MFKLSVSTNPPNINILIKLNSIAIMSKCFIDIFISFSELFLKLKKVIINSSISHLYLRKSLNIDYLLNFLAFFSFDWITGCLNTNWIIFFYKFSRRKIKRNCNNLIHIFGNDSLLYCRGFIQI